MDEIREIKGILDSNTAKAVYFQITEDVYGYFKPKAGEINGYREITEAWENLEGAITVKGNSEFNSRVYEGDFMIRTEHWVDKNWLKAKFEDYYSYLSELEEDDDELFLWDFIDFGENEGLFEANPEYGLYGDGVLGEEFSKSSSEILENGGISALLEFQSRSNNKRKELLSTKLETYSGKDDIETGIITEGHGKDYSLRFTF